MIETILIINRWDDDFSRYHEYIDHHLHRVAYITNATGSNIIKRELACGVEIVADITDAIEVVEAARRLARMVGPFTRVLALSEFDLETGAIVRDALAVQGVSLLQVRRFKDKVIMKQTVCTAKLPAPKYASLSESSTADTILELLGLPLILKPRVGASSRGVVKILTKAELIEALRHINLQDYECEQYIEGPIYHVDGLVRDGKILFHTVSRYINTCLSFNDGTPLGSVLLESSELKKDLVVFTGAVLDALELQTGAFHLEIIQSQRAGQEDQLIFLEIGARVGGGEIPFLGQALFGLDMMKAWVDLELGQNADYLQAIDSARMGGFLMIPEPREVPARLISVVSLVGKVDCLLKETLPPVGYVFDGKGGYEHISGRFLFEGASAGMVEAAIHNAIEKFTMVTEGIQRSA